jgi:SAM-dependent methyltransferase
MDYLESLASIKATFRGGKDKHVVSDAIVRRFPGRTDIRVLDVGVGDGSYIAKVSGLARVAGLQLQVLGIDPLLTERKKLGQSIECLPVSLEEFPISQEYDVIHARHSLYYSADLDLALMKLCSGVRQGGMIVASLWSSRCDLYRLHREITHRQPGVTAEDVLNSIGTVCRPGDVRITYCSGVVEVAAWRSPGLIPAAYRIVSRAPVDREPSSAELQAFAVLLSREPDLVHRENGIVFGYFD